jgi:hypothetical protein
MLVVQQRNFEEYRAFKYASSTNSEDYCDIYSSFGLHECHANEINVSFPNLKIYLIAFAWKPHGYCLSGNALLALKQDKARGDLSKKMLGSNPAKAREWAFQSQRRPRFQSNAAHSRKTMCVACVPT